MFENTMTHLVDPKSGKSVHLIGTTHASTQLAFRTKKLISDLKPDAVYVQTSEAWAEKAEKIQNVNSQEDMDNYNYILNESNNFSGVNMSIRSIPFFLRFYPWLALLNYTIGFPPEFHPFLPGLEMKFALDEAKKLNSEIHFGGLEMDEFTMKGLYHETRMDLFPLIHRLAGKTGCGLWLDEYEDIRNLVNTFGAEAFAESIDRSRANWFVKYFEKISPRQKKIVIDMKDDWIFRTLFRRIKAKKIVAVVNQWHMAGIESMWKSHTETEEKLEPINPVGDMDINQIMEGNMINDSLRMITSRITKSEPATWSNYLTLYNKEPYESHRTRHINFNDAYDPHMYHGLPWDAHGHKMDPKIQFNIRPNKLDLNSKEGLEELKRIVKDQEKHIDHH